MQLTTFPGIDLLCTLRCIYFQRPWTKKTVSTTFHLKPSLRGFILSVCRLLLGEGSGNPLQCSCLENPRDRGTWWASVYGVAQSQTRLMWLSSSSRLLLKSTPESPTINIIPLPLTIFPHYTSSVCPCPFLLQVNCHLCLLRLNLVSQLTLLMLPRHQLPAVSWHGSPPSQPSPALPFCFPTFLIFLPVFPLFPS